MVYCYTDDYTIFLGNCVNTKAYFILCVTDPVEDSYIVGGQSGFFYNEYGWVGSSYSDGDVLYIYESIEEAEEDDEEMADVLMYYNDIMLCYNISAEELKTIYSENFNKNMNRW